MVVVPDFLLCFVPLFFVCFLGKRDFFFKLGNSRRWKKRREAERGVGLSFLFLFSMGRGGLNLG